ncbi:unnamed protein product [Sympodiomycopsis kandeliae]
MSLVLTGDCQKRGTMNSSPFHGEWILTFTDGPRDYQPSRHEPRVHGRLSEAEYDELLTFEALRSTRTPEQVAAKKA